MNVKLLREVEKFLQAEPRRFDMNEGIVDAKSLHSVLDQPPCGTACCIAGAAYIIEKKIEKTLDHTDKEWQSIRRTAEKALDLTSVAAERLFYDESWPSIFREAYNSAKTPKGRVSAGVRRIEHFIKTNGEE